MAVTSRVAQVRVVNSSDGSAYRQLNATAAVQDTEAGASVVLTCTAATANGTLGAPVQPTNVDLYLLIDNGSTIIIPFVLSWVNSQTQTFYFTVDGLVGGAARAGLVRIKVRLRQTAGLAATQYDSSSEGGLYGTAANSHGINTSTDASSTWPGYIRGTTTASTVLAGVGTLAYSDMLTATTTLGAAPFQSRTLNVTLAPLNAIASAASTAVTFTTALGTVDNRFPASSASRTTAVTFPNASLVAIPWTTATLTETTRTIDPRIFFTHIKQENSNTFATPPTSGDTGLVHKNDDLGFLNARVTDANSTGRNSITWTDTLQDVQGLIVPALTRSVTSATVNGQAGVGASFLTWSELKPPGIWNKVCTITAPAGAVGLESGNTAAYTMVVPNANLRCISAGGPVSTATESTHFSPGDVFLTGLIVANMSLGQTVALDTSPVPAVALGRFNQTLGRAEYLDSDEVTWLPTNGATFYFHPLTVSPGDSNVWTKAFTSTSGWGPGDVTTIGRAYVASVLITSFQKEPIVGNKNRHDRYAFDGAGFVGFPQK